jgi:predicted ester cyclase
MDIRDTALRFVEEVWQQRTPDAVFRFTGPAFIDHAYSPGTAAGHARMVDTFCAAFSAARHTVEHAAAQGDMVLMRLRLTATHSGRFREHEASGALIDVQQYRSFRFDGGRLVEHWALLDTTALLRQIAP